MFKVKDNNLYVKALSNTILNDTANFGDIIRNNRIHYIDKSLLLKRILNDGSARAVFISPQRCGKSLNLSMLQHFFSSSVDKKATKELFATLQINQEEYSRYMDHQGKYTVILLDFNDVKIDSYTKLHKVLSDKIELLYHQHSYLLEADCLNKYDREYFNLILNMKDSKNQDNSLIDANDLAYSFQKIIKFISEYNAEKNNDKYYKPIVLIDGYDNLLSQDCKQSESLIRAFFSILKDNNDCERSIITGKSLNLNLLPSQTSYYFLHDEGIYKGYFGFTEGEVKKILEESKLSLDLFNLIKADFYLRENKYCLIQQDFEGLPQEHIWHKKSSSFWYYRETVPVFNPMTVFDFVNKVINDSKFSPWVADKL